MATRELTQRIMIGVLAGFIGVGLTACATPRPEEVSSSTKLPSERAELLLTPGYPVTVIDRGDGATLCLGSVGQSNPPVCGGVALIGWDWDEVPGTYEESMGVRWGDYLVTGHYDVVQRELTVVSAIDGAEVPQPDLGEHPTRFPTECAEPEGGWSIIDEAKATQESMSAATALASQLDGFATSWVDNALIPPVPERTEPLDELQHYAVNAGLTIINVAVRGDAAAAEARLRTVWGGALCVYTVDYTAVELDAVLKEIMADHPLFLGAHADGMTGDIALSVAYDAEGALQRELDARYGAGLVHVHSVLKAPDA